MLLLVFLLNIFISASWRGWTMRESRAIWELIVKAIDKELALDLIRDIGCNVRNRRVACFGSKENRRFSRSLLFKGIYWRTREALLLFNGNLFVADLRFVIIIFILFKKMSRVKIVLCKHDHFVWFLMAAHIVRLITGEIIKYLLWL